MSADQRYRDLELRLNKAEARILQLEEQLNGSKALTLSTAQENLIIQKAHNITRADILKTIKPALEQINSAIRMQMDDGHDAINQHRFNVMGMTKTEDTTRLIGGPSSRPKQSDFVHVAWKDTDD